MLFNSVEFLVFFPVVTVLYFLLPQKYRWCLLLAASCAFYMAFIPAYILILAVTIAIDFLAGILIEDSRVERKRALLAVSVVSTCLVLFVFKYFDFFNGSVASAARLLGWNYPIGAARIILPIGLSFHTFQSLSYVIEVYRGRQRAERHFGIYALYVMFYPQLVAGPIERPQNLLHQFREVHRFDYGEAVDGLKLMAWGFFKKLVIADRLALLVNRVYDKPADFGGFTLALATVFFAYQIYCDFSGYSDIARGAARVMGFRLMLNFRTPYYSKSISEFWKRWHISLSSWFKDYLYISLGGNRVSNRRWQLNLFITFLVSGLWHGANWTYVAWGALNGLFLVFSLRTERFRERIAEALGLVRFPRLREYWKILVTFALTCFAWTFFRARNLSDWWCIATRLLYGYDWASIASDLASLEVAGLGKTYFMTSLLAVAAMEVFQLAQRRASVRDIVSAWPLWLRWGAYYSVVLGTIFLGILGKNNFIYFQF